MRKFLAIVVCKLGRFVGKLVGKGSSLPGKYALKLCPDILRRVTLPPRVVAVTGSNGKTSTVEMIAAILRADGSLDRKALGAIAFSAQEKKEKLDEIIEVLPGMKSPTITPLANDEWVSVQSVIAEKHFWEIIGKLKSLGAEGILVLPIEKMIV